MTARARLPKSPRERDLHVLVQFAALHRDRFVFRKRRSRGNIFADAGGSRGDAAAKDSAVVCSNRALRDDMNDEIPFVLAAVAMIPLLARLAGSSALL